MASFANASARLRSWIDRHRFPFLAGSDGQTFRQRRRSAEAYARRMTSPPRADYAALAESQDDEDRGHAAALRERRRGSDTE